MGENTVVAIGPICSNECRMKPEIPEAIALSKRVTR